MSDLFREVDEALKKERAEKFWHDHKDKIITAIVLVLITVAVVMLFQKMQENRAAEQTAQIYSAVRIAAQENATQQNTAGTDSQTGEVNFGETAIGRLLAAGYEVDRNNMQAAGENYNALINDSAGNKALQDLARLLATQQENNSDRLVPIINNEDSPFYWHARLVSAAESAQAGEYDQALQMLEVFDNQERVRGRVNPSLLQRAYAMQHIYRIEQSSAQAGSSNDMTGNEDS